MTTRYDQALRSKVIIWSFGLQLFETSSFGRFSNTTEHSPEHRSGELLNGNFSRDSGLQHSRTSSFEGFSLKTLQFPRMINWKTPKQALLQSFRSLVLQTFGLRRFFQHNTTLPPKSEVANPRMGASLEFHYSGASELHASKCFLTQNYNSLE
jgi:hypothetical protein